MKSLFFKWFTIRLYLVLALASRFFIAYLVARHLHVPIQDALIGVLLFTASWTDTQLYFSKSKLATPKESHVESPQLNQAIRTLLQHQESIQKPLFKG